MTNPSEYLKSFPKELKDRLAPLITKGLAYDLIVKIMTNDYGDVPGIAGLDQQKAVIMTLTIAESFLANGGHPVAPSSEDSEAVHDTAVPHLTPSFGRDNTPKVV